MKKCTICKIEKDVAEFGKDRSRGDGLNYKCKGCHNFYSKLDWKKYRSARQEKNRRWAINNPERTKQMGIKHYLKDKEGFKRRTREWCKKHPEYVAYQRSLRRARIKQAMPKWVDKKKIRQIYEQRPKGMVVDHIVPLTGKNVSGLHIPENLQYLTVSENCIKRNRF